MRTLIATAARSLTSLALVALCLATLCLVTLSRTTVFAESAAGLSWKAPAEWKAGPPQNMRAATYAVPAAAGDTVGGECAVYSFGPGQGGPVDANIDRWTSQFAGPGGKPVTPVVAKRTVKGVAMTTIDVSGDYSGMGGPTGPRRIANGYRLLGAVVEGPGGNIFVKFTAPAKTVAANKAKYDLLIASFQKDK